MRSDGGVSRATIRRQIDGGLNTFCSILWVAGAGAAGARSPTCQKAPLRQGASDEEWLALIGQMSRAKNPGQVFLRRALSNAWLLAQGT